MALALVSWMKMTIQPPHTSRFNEIILKHSHIIFYISSSDITYKFVFNASTDDEDILNKIDVVVN
jgi:hypothetical protein